MAKWALLGLVAFCTGGSAIAAGQESTAAASAADVFEQRIMPIFRSPQPASCVQCHLAAVDLKDYILPSHEQTFASLRDQGLINLAEPENSKILTLIRMGDKDLDQGARLIHEKQRQAEYDAFASWILACCNDPKLRDLPALPADKIARPDRPDEVIRHTRKSRVVDSFVRNVWSQRMRCFPCHTPHELDESDPKHRVAIQRHKEFMAKVGAEYAQRMDIFRETPEATIQSLIEKSRDVPKGELPLIDLNHPARSMLVLKPTSKVPEKNAQGEFEKPSYVEPVSHMGGLKMHVDDASYKSFIAWIQDYARVTGDQYASVDELPADDWQATQHVLMMREVPDEWAVESRVQFLIHAWNHDTESWQAEPIAFTQGIVTPIRNAAGPLFLFGSNNSSGNAQITADSARLMPGKYLVKAYVDSKNRLAQDPTRLLPDDDFVGQVAIDAKWRDGFPQAERIFGEMLKRP
jgi:hypothetical protein